MRFVLIEVPFHMGLQEIGVGRGPARFLQAGADGALGGAAGPAEVLHVRKRDASTSGLDAVVDLNRQVGRAVRDAIAAGSCPVVLAGNCNAALGALAGIESERVGIVWLDAHGDFNTPATSISGMLDGMALAAAVGHCHAELCERIGLRRAVAEENALLLGFRDLDRKERERLAASRVRSRGANDLADAPAPLADLGKRVDAVYLHLDADFLDAAESPGVDFRGPGGVPLARAQELVAAIGRELPIAAVTLANHNPEHDPEGLTARAGVRLLSTLAAAFPSLAPRSAA